MVANTRDSLFGSVRIQMRILHALLMREIITRYGRHNIGFAWLFAEPMLFTIGVTALWHILHVGGASHSINVTAFAITSYPTVLIWRSTIGRCALAIEPNQSLLAHRNVRPIDFFWSRIILELSGITMAVVVMLSGAVALDLIPAPADILTMMWGWLLLCWYAMAMGLVIGGLTEFSELVERLWHPISYFQLPVSGAFAMAAWLPENLRNMVLLFPVADAVEIYRYGYFGDSITPYYNTEYTVVCCLLLTWLGLFIVRSASMRLEAK